MNEPAVGLPDYLPRALVLPTSRTTQARASPCLILLKLARSAGIRAETASLPPPLAFVFSTLPNFHLACWHGTFPNLHAPSVDPSLSPFQLHWISYRNLRVDVFVSFTTLPHRRCPDLLRFHWPASNTHRRSIRHGRACISYFPSALPISLSTSWSSFSSTLSHHASLAYTTSPGSTQSASQAINHFAKTSQ